MKTSLKGRMAIAKSEGIVLSRYKDAVGVWTMGIGHTTLAGKPDPKYFEGELSMPEVFEMFAKDLKKYEDRVNRAVKVPMTQEQFDALVSFDYNTGGIFKATLVKTFNAGDEVKAAKQFMNWTKAGGKSLDALKKRRREEADIFLNGKYPKPVATLYPATRSGKVQWSKGRNVDLTKLLSSETLDNVVEFTKPTFIPDVPPIEVTTTVVKKKDNFIVAIIKAILKIFGKK